MYLSYILKEYHWRLISWNVDIADRLVKLRKKNGFSQEALADKIGVSRQAVSKWERSESSPDTDNLISLAKIYNLTMDEILYSDHNTIAPTIETSTDDTVYNINEKWFNLKKALPFLPYILFAIVVNLMALSGGWWHPALPYCFWRTDAEEVF